MIATGSMLLASLAVIVVVTVVLIVQRWRSLAISLWREYASTGSDRHQEGPWPAEH